MRRFEWIEWNLHEIDVHGLSVLRAEATSMPTLQPDLRSERLKALDEPVRLPAAQFVSERRRRGRPRSASVLPLCFGRQPEFPCFRRFARLAGQFCEPPAVRLGLDEMDIADREPSPSGSSARERLRRTASSRHWTSRSQGPRAPISPRSMIEETSSDGTWTPRALSTGLWRTPSPSPPP